MKYGMCADCGIVPLTHCKAVACTGCNQFRKSNYTEWWLKYESSRWCQAGRPYKPLRKNRKNLWAAAWFLFREQHGLCKFCHQLLERPNAFHLGSWERPYVDHDHKSDGVRGLVHPVCNRLIGAIENIVLEVELPAETILERFSAYTA